MRTRTARFLLTCIAPVTLFSPISEGAIGVEVTVEDEPILSDRIRTADPNHVSASDWFRARALDALTDETDGLQLFEFSDGAATDRQLLLRIHHRRGEPPWPSGDVQLEFRVANVPEAQNQRYVMPILARLSEEPERASYVDDWFSRKLRVALQTGALYRNVLAYVPIKTVAKAQGKRIVTTLPPLAHRSALLSVRWSDTSLWFVPCDSQRLAGPLYRQAPEQPRDCSGATIWTATPKQWDHVYVERVWGEY